MKRYVVESTTKVTFVVGGASHGMPHCGKKAGKLQYHDTFVDPLRSLQYNVHSKYQFLIKEGIHFFT